MASACAIEFFLIPCVCVCEMAWRMGSGVQIKLGRSEAPEVPWMAAPSGLSAGRMQGVWAARHPDGLGTPEQH